MPREDWLWVQDDEFIALGWPRWLPHNALLLHAAIKYLGDSMIPGDLQEQSAVSEIGDLLGSIGGLDGLASTPEEPCPLHPSLGAPSPRVLEKQHEKYIQRAARAVEMKLVRTNRQTVELMRRLDLVDPLHVEGVLYWRAVRPLPLPSEKIPMSAAELEEEDRLRWRAIHIERTRRLVRILSTQRLDERPVALRDIAEALGEDVEAVRQVLLGLMNDECVKSSRSLDRLDPADQFSLSVDWRVIEERGLGL